MSLRADELLKQLVQPEERMKKEVGNDVVVVSLQFFCAVNAKDVKSFIATLGGKMKSVVSA